MKEALKYYEEIRNDYQKGKINVVRNSDRSHNAMIMRLMLESSDEISMFCGEMSIFRKGFYDHIKTENKERGEKIEALISKALKDFIGREQAKLNIILPSFDESFLNDLIVEKEEFRKVANIHVLPSIDDKGYNEALKQLNHFSYTKDKKITRIEDDMDLHEATLIIGLVEPIAEKTKSIFNRLSKTAVAV
ncbi:MAG: hypothetical protein HDS42_02030 [Bacteroides sp.]|nr:hypothetical protein [Bacteroides sp.]